MNYFGFGDRIDYKSFNALVYLLRKFKKLTASLILGESTLNTDYGDLQFTEGFVSKGNNWILEDSVTVTSNNVLPNCFYTLVFSVIDVNTSGVVNRRSVRVESGSTGENGTLELTIPLDLISNDEVFLPDFSLEVIFDEHEYYTPLPNVEFSLSVDKLLVNEGEIATIHGVLLDGTGSPLIGRSVPVVVGGRLIPCVTDSNGVIEYMYTGTGVIGRVDVSAFGESVFFYDGGLLIATVTGKDIALRNIGTGGDVLIGWGDGTTDTVNNPQRLTHTYSDGLNEHTIIFYGTVTSLGNQCFNGSGLTSVVIPDSVTRLGDACFFECTGLTSVVIPDSVTSLGDYCFIECTGLTSISIPDSVTSLGDYCFMRCTGLTSISIPDSVTSLGDFCFVECIGLTSISIPDSVTSLGDFCFHACLSLLDYELYWETSPIQYNSSNMPVNTNTVFTVPYGTTQTYVDANYPLNRLVERQPLIPLNTSLSIQSDKVSVYTDESVVISGTLLDENDNPVKQASIKLYDGSTLIDTMQTDNTGVYSKTLTGLTTGTHSLHTSFDATTGYNASTSTNISITVSEHQYDLTVSCSTPIIQTGDSAIVTVSLTRDGGAYSGETLSYTVMHGTTQIDTGSVVTDSDGTATISYTGTGVGDVTFEVSYGTLLQKTYELEDLLKYDTCQTDKTSSYTSPTVFRGSGTPLFAFENGYGYKLGKSTGLGDVWLPIYDITGLTSYKIEFDQYCNNNNNSSNNGILFYKDSNNYHEFFYAIQSSCNYFNLTSINGSINYTNPSASNISSNTWVHYEVTVENGSIALKVTRNDTVLYQNTYTLAVNPVKVGVVTGWSTGHSYVKNIKVKAL